MKKIAILTSVLALAACGGGSGGGGSATNQDGSTITPDYNLNGGGSGGTVNNPSIPVAFGNTEIPTSRISSDAVTSNSYVTGMDSSVTNIAEMTAMVESIIGTEALNELANNLDSISSSNSNTTNRSASAKRSALRTLSGFNDLAKAANYTMTSTEDVLKEMAQKTYDEILQTLKDIPAFIANIWFKMLCYANRSCNSYSLEELATMIHEQTTHNHWHDFYEQNQYHEYTLENVEFTMAATSGDGGDESANFKDVLSFELDPKTGAIAKVHYKVYDRNGDEDEEHAAIFNRIGDTKTFNIYQNAGHGSTYDGDGEIITYGKNVHVPLKYSDFGEIAGGMLETDSEGNETFVVDYREPFAGGYKELRKEAPETAMNFSGKAVGNLQQGHFDMNINGNASLKFDTNRTETLSMNFSNPDEKGTPWYDVEIIRNKDENTDSITFKTKNGLVVPDEVKFNDFNENNTRTKYNYLVDGYNFEGWGHDHTEGVGHGKLDIGYYGGSDGNVTEATGVTQYVERPTNGEHDLRMTVGFGMAKDNQ